VEILDTGMEIFSKKDRALSSPGSGTETSEDPIKREVTRSQKSWVG